MEKEFVTYEQSLSLKELGFDEDCFGFYNDMENNKPMGGNFPCDGRNSAPLYQQAFDYILKFHLKKYSVETFSDDRVRIYDENNNSTDFINKDNCLRKLIEIVKDNVEL